MNTAERRAKAEGYQYTGTTVKERQKEEILPRYEEYKAEAKKFGSKVKLILCAEEYNFRGGKKRSTFWTVFIKYSDAHKDYLNEQRLKERREQHERELMKLADTLSMEDITYMLNYKLARLTLNTNQEVKE